MSGPRLRFALPPIVRKGLAVVMGLLLVLGSEGVVCAATEGYDPLKQITQQVLRPNLMIVQDRSGSMRLDVYGNELFEGDDSVERLGISAVAISIDSAGPSVHDAFRGAEGVWERAVDAVRLCRDEDIGVQINMSVMRPAMRDVREVIEVGTALGVRDYQVFFPVPTEGHN